MYQFIVEIPNPPLAITRHFQCVDDAQADRFIGWLKAQGLKYSVHYTNPYSADDAIRAVEWEQRLASKGLVSEDEERRFASDFAYASPVEPRDNRNRG